MLLRWLTSTVATVLACCAWLQADVALAESSYDAWIDEAVDAVEFGDLPRAHAAFASAHRVEASARALRGMGIVSYRMGQYARAVIELEAALHEFARPLPRHLRASVEKVLGSARKRVGYCIIEATPADAIVTVAGIRTALDLQPRILLVAGPHELRVEAPGYEAMTTHVEIEPGEVVRVALELRLLQPEPPANEVDHPVTAIDTMAVAAEARSSDRVLPLLSPPERDIDTAAASPRNRTWAWVAAGAVPAFALGAGLAWNEAVDIGDGIATRCGRVGCTADQKRDAIEQSDLRSFEVLASTGLALAAASAVVAVCLFVIEGAGDRVRSSARLRMPTLEASF